MDIQPTLILLAQRELLTEELNQSSLRLIPQEKPSRSQNQLPLEQMEPQLLISLQPLQMEALHLSLNQLQLHLMVEPLLMLPVLMLMEDKQVTLFCPQPAHHLSHHQVHTQLQMVVRSSIHTLQLQMDIQLLHTPLNQQEMDMKL
jgi:hypothetical protein